MSKNFELLRQIGKDSNLFRTSRNATAVIGTAEYEAPATTERVAHEPEPQIVHLEPEPQVVRREPELPLPRQEAPLPKRPVETTRQQPRKRETKNWTSRILNKNAPRAAEVERIARVEEIKLVQRVFPFGGQASPQLAMFCGLEEGPATAAICARTAEILASRREGSVCVIDANLAGPYLHRHFRMENTKGLSEALGSDAPVQDFVLTVSGTSLWMMPAGVANVDLSAMELTERLHSRMAELRTLFKYVIVHSPLYLNGAPAPVSFGVDGAVLVVEANSTRRETVRDVMHELQVLGARVLGVVLNNRTFPIPDAIYHKI